LNPGPGGGDDTLQAGVTATVGAGCTVTYVPWYEWTTTECNPNVNSLIYPCNQTSIMNFPVNQGDYMYIVVTYNGTNSQGVPQGSAFVEDQTTGQYTTASFYEPSAPGSSVPDSNTLYAGSSAEWIVERVTENPSGNYSNLANYQATPGSSPSGLYLFTAYNDYQLGSPPANTIYPQYMYCLPANWIPSNNCPLVNQVPQFISEPTLTYGGGGAFLYMVVNPTGPAVNQ
jgi:hypothetical protein